MLNKYYDEELRFFREEGKEFARRYPDAGSLFERGGDPDVERLLEGVAFLCGRIRQQLDDGLPELSQALLNLIHPHFLRPLPRASILAFEPIRGKVTSSRLIPKHTEVQATVRNGTTYRFRTASDVTLHPFTISSVVEATVNGMRQVRLVFQALPGARLDEGSVDELPVYIRGADWADALATYQWFGRHATRVQVVTGDRRTSSDLPLPKPCGFAPSEELFPYPSTSFFGFRLLQEFFAFPQKFAGMKFTGLSASRHHGGEFELLITFDKPRDTATRLIAEHFTLYCTPVVNVFESDSQPIRFDRTKTEYLVQPTGGPSHEIVAVNGAAGRVAGTSQQKLYKPFFSFDLDANNSDGCYYHIHLREPTVGMASPDNPVAVTAQPPRVVASFVDLNRQPVSTLPTDVVVFNLTCTNSAAEDEPRVGDIRKPSDSSPAFAHFSNIGPVSPLVPVPSAENTYWRLISHVSLNQISFEDVNAFKALLRAYNWEHLRSATLGLPGDRCIQAIESIDCRSGELIVTEALWPDETAGPRFGTPIHGRLVTITLQEQDLSPGESFLFGGVLNAFIGSYCSLNAFSRLTMKTKPTNDEYVWPPQLGHQPLL